MELPRVKTGKIDMMTFLKHHLLHSQWGWKSHIMTPTVLHCTENSKVQCFHIV